MEKILILDFGSQYTQLIARRVREAEVFSELHPWDMTEDEIREFKPSGIILSGGPNSVYEEQTPQAPMYCIRTGCAGAGHLLWHANHGGSIGRHWLKQVIRANLVMQKF